ncbi:MAG: hypothetical protein KDB07_04730 [Planctomycetes bacterium]|nr:hypothetical protein [Planctomycetota bacterium]
MTPERAEPQTRQDAISADSTPKSELAPENFTYFAATPAWLIGAKKLSPIAVLFYSKLITIVRSGYKLTLDIEIDEVNRIITGNFAEFGRELGISKAYTTKILDKLQHYGLIRRKSVDGLGKSAIQLMRLRPDYHFAVLEINYAGYVYFIKDLAKQRGINNAKAMLQFPPPQHLPWSDVLDILDLLDIQKYEYAHVVKYQHKGMVSLLSQSSFTGENDQFTIVNDGFTIVNDCNLCKTREPAKNKGQKAAKSEIDSLRDSRALRDFSMGARVSPNEGKETPLPDSQVPKKGTPKKGSPNLGTPKEGSPPSGASTPQREKESGMPTDKQREAFSSVFGSTPKKKRNTIRDKVLLLKEALKQGNTVFKTDEEALRSVLGKDDGSQIVSMESLLQGAKAYGEALARLEKRSKKLKDDWSQFIPTKLSTWLSGRYYDVKVIHEMEERMEKHRNTGKKAKKKKRRSVLLNVPVETVVATRGPDPMQAILLETKDHSVVGRHLIITDKYGRKSYAILVDIIPEDKLSLFPPELVSEAQKGNRVYEEDAYTFARRECILLRKGEVDPEWMKMILISL